MTVEHIISVDHSTEMFLLIMFPLSLQTIITPMLSHGEGISYAYNNNSLILHQCRIGCVIRCDLYDSADIAQSHNKLVTQINIVLCTGSFLSLDAIVKIKLLKKLLPETLWV